MQSVTGLSGGSFGRSLLVLGGARSGKSRHAQAVAEAVAGAGTSPTGQDIRRVFVATAQAFDDEMTDRIARHKADRDDRWQTVEAPLRLSEALATADSTGTIFLVDCLTLWLSNQLLVEASIDHEVDVLLATVSTLAGRVILVSNEVGSGIVPDNALARRFRDAAGVMHQRLAATLDTVDLVVAGLPQRLKAPSVPGA